MLQGERGQHGCPGWVDKISGCYEFSPDHSWFVSWLYLRLHLYGNHFRCKRIMQLIVQQCCERIDRTRGVACNQLLSLIHCTRCVSVCVSACPWGGLFVCLSVCLCVCMSVCVFVCVSLCLYLSVFVCLSVCLCLSVWLLTHFWIHVQHYSYIISISSHSPIIPNIPHHKELLHIFSR